MPQLQCIFFEDTFFKPMKVKCDGSSLYRAIASHIMSFGIVDVWTDRFLPGKEPGIKPATFDVANDLKERETIKCSKK